jgi:hypothetical protein
MQWDRTQVLSPTEDFWHLAGLSPGTPQQTVHSPSALPRCPATGEILKAIIKRTSSAERSVVRFIGKRFLDESPHLPRGRLAVVGYGPFHPSLPDKVPAKSLAMKEHVTAKIGHKRTAA